MIVFTSDHLCDHHLQHASYDHELLFKSNSILVATLINVSKVRHDQLQLDAAYEVRQHTVIVH